MKKLMSANVLVGLAGLALLATTSASAQIQRTQGQVISSTPIYESVQVPTQREVCWDEQVRYRGRRSATPGLLGGIVGGAVGRQFGGGRGRDALTVVGAIVGASVANDVQHNRHRDYRRVETRCRTANEYYREERITGYRVEYEYNGQVYTTRLDNDPGPVIDLQVSVNPVSR
ncbi:MAG: glycine zipper 2TM domain-containing protein [Pseudomonadota bacterium]